MQVDNIFDNSIFEKNKRCVRKKYQKAYSIKLSDDYLFLFVPANFMHSTHHKTNDNSGQETAKQKIKRDMSINEMDDWYNKAYQEYNCIDPKFYPNFLIYLIPIQMFHNLKTNNLTSI